VTVWARHSGSITRSQGLVPGLAGVHLDDPAGDHVARVAVGHGGADRVREAEVRAPGDVLLEDVVASAEVLEEIAIDALVCVSG
jgi:hypothetical protein